MPPLTYCIELITLEFVHQTIVTTLKYTINFVVCCISYTNSKVITLTAKILFEILPIASNS